MYKDVVRVAMNDIQLELAKQADQDLKQKQEEAKVAGEQYREGHKANKLKLEFLTECLRSRGEDVPSIEDFLTKVANGEITEENQ
jgi:hypothetical protein